MQCEILEIKLDTIYTNEITIYFRSGIFLSSIDTVQVFTLIGITNFHVINILSRFFLIKDMDIINIYLNNTTNQLIWQNGKNISIFC